MERLNLLLAWTLWSLASFSTLVASGNPLGTSPLPAVTDGYSVANGASEAPWIEAALSNSQPGVQQPAECCDGIHHVARAREFNRRFRVFGGYEFGWLQPRFTENVSVVETRPTGDRAYAFDHPFEITPRVWAGIENSRCTGVRARYWDFRTDAPRQVRFATAGATPLSLTIFGGSGNLIRTATAVAGDAMTSDQRLEMRTFDLEGTQRIRFTRTETVASFGLRYAKTHLRTHAVATNAGGSLTELVCQDLDFDGFGPTASVEIKRILFCDDSLFRGLSFFADARGSILLGKKEQEIVLVTGGGATLAEDEYVHDDFLPIAELLGGLQWQMQPFQRGLWTIRTGYRVESWFGVGGPIDTNSNLGLHGMILSIAASW